MKKNRLYQVRSFGEKFNASFDSFKRAWKILFRFSLYLLLPLSLLQTIGMDEYYSNVFASAAIGTDTPDQMTAIIQNGPAFSLIIAVSFVGTAFVVSLVYGLMKKYQQGGSLDGLTFKTFWKEAQGRGFQRVCNILLFGMLLTILAFLVVGLLAAASLYSLIVTLPALLVFMVPLSLWAPIYLIEDDTHLVEALRKSYRYGMKTWGSLFVLALVMTVIVYAVSCLLQIPGMVMIGIKALAFPQLEGFGSIAYSFITYVVMAAGTFFSWIAMLPYLFAFGYHYGSAAEQIDNVTAAEDIAHFDEMGDNNVDDPAFESKRSDIDDFEEL